MVEIFETNVEKKNEADAVAGLIVKHFPDFTVNFDLHDIDNILRIEGEIICPDNIIDLVKSINVNCSVIE